MAATGQLLRRPRRPANDRPIVPDRGQRAGRGVGRLAPGQSIDAATHEIEAIGQQLEREYPDKNAGVGMTLRPLQAHSVRDVRTALLVLLGAVGFVLLMACANVANLFLARAVHREGEMAIRAALGGNRVRLIRQVITESLVLAVGGGALGLMLAVWGTDVLVHLKPQGIPRLDEVRLDAAVLQTIEEVLAASVSQSRFYTLLLGTFATVALLLAAIGIFGVMSHAVAYRTREIGIRLALGAQGSHVRGLVLREALRLACLGIVVGLAAALPLTTVLRSLLFELTPTDPVTLVGVAVVLLGVALGASCLPTWRASRVDPLIALRME